ncbi:glycosyl hydrolase family 61-domain-containing protein [Podospora didyma]|uniref:lytic cellulose monooxygenase (C4-dehydrogenating) n=1 Tax=Podospora didyma TaxID=330526 RepID=A0AAE0NGK2_9PEZI|nr:glycosyl hydrolase family 61-domain-containing protein [Podospora didyma]
MKASIVTQVGLALLPTALCHNIHGILLINGTASPEWKYVLDVEGPFSVNTEDYPPGYQGRKLEPIIGPADPNITCGRAAFNAASHTETADVLAGSEVGFRVSADGDGNRDETHHPVFWHPGPAQIYLSRAPDDNLRDYRGDGDWFKIAYAGPVDDGHWSLWWPVSEFNFTIPKTTPPGKYLMRIENFMPTDHTDYQQFYVNCAFINVLGPGGGVPTGLARFPGTYQPEDPGLLVPLNQDLLSGRLQPEEMRLMQYRPPGPEVWTS